MIFSSTDRNKYLKRRLIGSPVYICLFLLLCSVASIIARQAESILIEKLEKHIFEDKISEPAVAISYNDYSAGNMRCRHVHRHHPGRSSSDQALFVIVSPMENKTDVLLTIVEPDHTGLSENVFNVPLNMEKELIGNAGLTTEEKHSIATFLNTLSYGSEQNHP